METYQPLSSIPSLSVTQKAALRTGKIVTVEDLLLKAPANLAKSCRIHVKEVENITDLVCKELAQEPRLLADVSREGEEKFTTGDPALDEALGGGIRTGMVWEIAGESAAVKQLAAKPGSKPVKLLVIDALAELFHTDDKPSSQTLFERGKNLTEISTLLHSLASKHRIAVVVLNEVVDTFYRAAGSELASSELRYSEQARWFGSAHSIPGEDKKAASLGHVWANQVNTRIMMSRTQRMRHLDDEYHRKKRRRLESDAETTFDHQTTRIRRLSVIFSCVTPPASLDYIVTDEGIVTLPEDMIPLPEPQPSAAPAAHAAPVTDYNLDEVSPLDFGASIHSNPADDLAVSNDDLANDLVQHAKAEAGPQEERDDWDEYWKDAETDEHLYNHLETDTHSPANTAPVV
ncbi:DNA repair protein XRCC3 [Grifola frondosa]|uniref:DNA repair protein XRCC3 n=1 Tax=Grifola frondosa TaxID=5627 RepID=A0A1C7MFH5_GRIFR|nr:DNA repair protein XRCC3 [Grifola frondosa]